ncbi:hypothetical protein EFD56_15165 [Rhizobium phaseoli]|nr:hypothetical protein EFD56_15165 [Rhizobium phaseoli]
MPQGGKSDEGKTGDTTRIREPEGGTETFGEALSKAGFVPANAGRKIVSQGKRRKSLKKRSSTDPNT